MGGCRCTYRSCRVRSGNGNHLFHYPVFDKVRCQQWLHNARRFDLLTLTVAQLKNRVVCNLHFKDEMFMNKKRDKLKYNAIPTEDGPYCDVDDNINADEENVVINLPLEGIDLDKDNTISCYPKKTHFPVKYVDFLTYSHGIDLEVKNPLMNTQVSQFNYDNDRFIQNDKNEHLSEITISNNLPVDNVRQEEKHIKASQCEADSKINTTQLHVIHNENINNNGKPNVSQRLNQVKVLLEKPECVTLNSKGSNCNMGPSCVLKINKSELQKSQDNLTQYEIEILPQDIDNTKELAEKENNSLIIKHKEDKLQKKILKRKELNAEIVTDIEEKRKFNMKIRDIIEANLNKLVEPDSQSPRVEKHVHNEQPSTSMSIESRLQRMENTLLSRIDHNTQQILDLKLLVKSDSNKVVNSGEKITRKTKGTQTLWSDKGHKKYLYDQLSEYLSPKLKNLVFEQLFINNMKIDYEHVEENSHSRPKRRKRKYSRI